MSCNSPGRKLAARIQTWVSPQLNYTLAIQLLMLCSWSSACFLDSPSSTLQSSQNHSMGGIGRCHPVQSSALSSQALNISKAGHFTASLGNLFHGLTTLSGISLDFCLCRLPLILSLDTAETRLLHLLLLLHQVFICFDEMYVIVNILYFSFSICLIIIFWVAERGCVWL